LENQLEIIKRGKSEVLNYLEEEFKKTDGDKEPVYILMKDDSHNLVITVAGHTFLGDGKFQLNGQRLKISNSKVIKLNK